MNETKQRLILAEQKAKELFHTVEDHWGKKIVRTGINTLQPYIADPPDLIIQKEDIEAAWHEANAWYFKQNNLTGAGYFNYVTDLTKRYGYEFGNAIAGHIVGHYPHEQPDDHNDVCLDVHPDNHHDILQPDKHGNKRHWMLELHFVERVNHIGAFFEQLLTAE